MSISALIEQLIKEFQLNRDIDYAYHVIHIIDLIEQVVPFQTTVTKREINNLNKAVKSTEFLLGYLINCDGAIKVNIDDKNVLFGGSLADGLNISAVEHIKNVLADVAKYHNNKPTNLGRPSKPIKEEILNIILGLWLKGTGKQPTSSPNSDTQAMKFCKRITEYLDEEIKPNLHFTHENIRSAIKAFKR